MRSPLARTMVQSIACSVGGCCDDFVDATQSKPATTRHHVKTYMLVSSFCLRGAIAIHLNYGGRTSAQQLALENVKPPFCSSSCIGPVCAQDRVVLRVSVKLVVAGFVACKSLRSSQVSSLWRSILASKP